MTTGRSINCTVVSMTCHLIRPNHLYWIKSVSWINNFLGIFVVTLACIARNGVWKFLSFCFRFSPLTFCLSLRSTNIQKNYNWTVHHLFTATWICIGIVAIALAQSHWSPTRLKTKTHRKAMRFQKESLDLYLAPPMTTLVRLHIARIYFCLDILSLLFCRWSLTVADNIYSYYTPPYLLMSQFFRSRWFGQFSLSFIVFALAISNERRRDVTNQVIRMYCEQQNENHKRNVRVLTTLINEKSSQSRDKGNSSERSRKNWKPLSGFWIFLGSWRCRSKIRILDREESRKLTISWKKLY